jgi:crotonobetainyl-CoA:carnitine CoA-transferase CaiB-like acyl-CoA transferase
MSPLSGVTVLDLTRVLAGPYCTMLLADMGARVIKIEQPVRGDDTRHWGPPFVGGESTYFLSINRNKESVTLDYKCEEGRHILASLVARADVMVENFKPGTLTRAGFGYEQLAPRHPRLVYASMSGFGQTGPRRDEPGYDAVLQAEGGLMSVTGGADGPPYRLGVAVADIVTGLLAAQGILLALYARERTGRGQLVDVGMLDAVTSMLTYQSGIYFATGTASGRMGNRHPSIAPYDSFATSDGTIVLAVGNDDQWQRFCAAAGLERLGADPRLKTNRGRVDHHDALEPEIVAVLRSRTRADWIATLSAAGVPCGSVRSVDEVLNDPQLRAREMIQTLSHAVAGQVSVLGVPIKLSDTPGAVRKAPPTLGEQTDAVLMQDLDLDAAQVARLRANGVV